jgi:hypothetical protein
MPRSQWGPIKTQHRLGLVLSWPWLTAVFLVRCADGRWMVRPSGRCPRAHRLGPDRVLVGCQPCSCCGGTQAALPELSGGGLMLRP